MRKLTFDQRAMLLKLLVEGNSIRGISRATYLSKTTIAKFIKDFGEFSEAVMKKYIKNLEIERLQMDEVHAFICSRSRNTPPENRAFAGTQWTWIAMCPDTKLVISYYVGDREVETATKFAKEVAKRIKTRPIQISTDGLRAYIDAVDTAFGVDIHYGQLIKNFAKNPENDNEMPVTLKKRIVGNPDEKYISTSYLERQNLTLRMSSRRYIRKSNGHSKKLECHLNALHIHYLHYNFARIHQSLRVTPAMEAGLIDELLSAEDLIYSFEEYEDWKLWSEYAERCKEKNVCPDSLESYIRNLKRKRRNADRAKMRASLPI
jgi:IS1 family transposase